MNRLTLIPWLATSISFLFVSGCAVPKFEPSVVSTRRSVFRGEIKEALASYEAQAQQSEKNAAAANYPEKYWGSAVRNYAEASRAARLSGQLQKAITYAGKALEIADKVKDPSLRLAAIEMLILAYRSVGNFDKARDLIEKGLQINNEIPANSATRRIWEANLKEKMGLELSRRGNYEKAAEALSESIYLTRGRESLISSSCRLIGAPAGCPDWIESVRGTVVLRLSYLANTNRRAGKLQEALEQYQDAFGFIKQWRLKFAYESDLYEGIGEIYRQQKKFSEALENLQKALALAESQRRSAAIKSTSVLIGNTLRTSGNPADAIPYYRKALGQVESTRSLLQSEEHRQSYFEQGLGVYASMIDVLSFSDNWQEAFNYTERARSRSFLDVLGSKVKLSRAKSGLLDEERALQERVAAIKASMSEDADGVIDSILSRKELSEAEQVYNDFLVRVRSQDKEQASLMSVEPLTLQQVQELIDPAQTLIEYFVTDSEVFVWVVEKDKLHFQRLAISKNDLAKQVKTLREMISSLGDAKELNEVSSSLYKSLIQPLLPHITGKELIVVPHDVLHYLPFQALVGADGRYLIEKYPINYLSSASLLQFTKEKRRAQGEKVLALGNLDLGDPKMNLEFAEIEAKEIKSLYPQSTIYLEKEATEEKAKSLSPQNDIIHFASHAELNEDDPLSSAVLLAKSDKEDGRLEVREIFGMDLKASLVVLSACETGLGKLSSGDELVGLTRAFIYAGTPSVVASLWNVEDSSTAQLMASFYKNLKTMTKVEALRQAQLNLIRGNINSDLLARRGIGGVGKLGEVPTVKFPSQDSVSNQISISTSHPFFWAPFILVGEGK